MDTKYRVIVTSQGRSGTYTEEKIFIRPANDGKTDKMFYQGLTSDLTDLGYTVKEITPIT